jgi:type IV pilus assembly protein PilQ
MSYLVSNAGRRWTLGIAKRTWLNVCSRLGAGWIVGAIISTFGLVVGCSPESSSLGGTALSTAAEQVQGDGLKLESTQLRLVPIGHESSIGSEDLLAKTRTPMKFTSWQQPTCDAEPVSESSQTAKQTAETTPTDDRSQSSSTLAYSQSPFARKSESLGSSIQLAQFEAPVETLPRSAADVNLPTESPQTIQVPTVPLAPPKNDIKVEVANDLITLLARDAPLDAVLAMIAEQRGLNIVSSETIGDNVTVKLSNVPLETALNAILDSSGYAWTMQGNIIIVSKLSSEKKLSPSSQGRIIRVFTLNYVAAEDIDNVVQGLLSPVGQSFVTATVSSDSRRAHEQLVVEDTADYVRRIEAYVREVDIAPRQVMIESHVLQVSLKGINRHGVDWNELFDIAGARVTFRTNGMAPVAPPMSTFQIEGTDMDNIITAIRSTTDSKTLASPKVAVLNGQEAHLQVGGKIGYLLTTTTQTSTLQSVSFLDVGVILKVTPIISESGQIMMKVNPSVSTGGINPTTSLPESETTEVETHVLLNDGEAIVIGGLIKETDIETKNKVPFLGDIWLVGRLFQRGEVTRERNEIIVTLLPRIIAPQMGCKVGDERSLQQAYTPLLYGDLQQMDRLQFEPRFNDSEIRHRNRIDYRPPEVPYHSPGPNPYAGEGPRGAWIYPDATSARDIQPTPWVGPIEVQNNMTQTQLQPEGNWQPPNGSETIATPLQPAPEMQSVEAGGQ